MDIVLRTPHHSELQALARTLAAWQVDDGVVQLHPGDLGWYSMRGPTATAHAMRAWVRAGHVVALGLLDGPDGLLRVALDPTLRLDRSLAGAIAADIADPQREVLPSGEAIVEVRGATALQHALRGEGFEPDEPWTPLRRDLTEPVVPESSAGGGGLASVVGLDRAAAWMEVHWSAFRGTPFGAEEEREVVDWWSTMMSGPFATDGRMLALTDPAGDTVAVAGVWSAGPGRPGLIEPMGVHRDHQGRGYGAAVCVAAASALRQLDACSAIVCAESSNTAAVSTYRAAGFTAGPQIEDLVRAG